MIGAITKNHCHLFAHLFKWVILNRCDVSVNILLLLQHHESNVDAKKRAVAELKRTAKDKDLENRILLNDIEELNVSVNERQHIHEASSKYDALL